MKCLFAFICIVLNKIIKFFQERPILSLVLMGGLWVNFLPLPDPNIVTVRAYNPLETTIPHQKALLIAGGEGFINPSSPNREKFDIVLHVKLMKTFPDWPARINYQKTQEEFYKSAIKKQTQLKRLRIKNTSGFYTKEEVDAINYFHRKGFYAKEQDPSMKPNIFDTRQSFLIKMHNPVMRKNFIKSFKRLEE